MNKNQKAMLEQKLRLQRGAAIIEGTQNKFRQDGYSNMLNKYGTVQDNSTAYRYNPEMITSDMELIRLYEGNGLFSKIINRPAEEAVKHGLDIDFGDEDISSYVEDRLDELGFEEKFATAEKWARLYGGSIIVMLVDDGGGLEEPLNWKNVRSIEELVVFERAIVQPDYTTMYGYNLLDTVNKGRVLGEPEYYNVTSLYGYFTVHRSRCLVFRNGKLPEHTSNAQYRYWGIPEYVRIKRALRECITSHEDGVKLLERCIQAIYKMKNLANMLSTSDGEDKVIQRLQVIDMARGILNSIAIDTDGEDYDYKNFSLSGVKEIIDSTCNMLSAVTDIPQAILFGRSPAGMNSTGESDFENYYNMVENIQKQNMKANTRTLVDLILKQGVLEGDIKEKPKYKVKFAALWSVSDTEQANIDKTKADTEYTKAQTAQVYMEANVLDPTEVRTSLAKEGGFDIEEVITEDDLDLPEDTFDLGYTEETGKQIFETNKPLPGTSEATVATDSRFDSAYDEWLEGHLEDFSSEDEEIEFAQIAKKEKDIDAIDKYWKDFKKNRKDGGSGSGNWGHEGVKGQRGGSAPGNGSSGGNNVVSSKDKSGFGKPGEYEVYRAGGIYDSPLGYLSFAVEKRQTSMYESSHPEEGVHKYKIKVKKPLTGTGEDAEKALVDAYKKLTGKTYPEDKIYDKETLTKANKELVKIATDKGYDTLLLDVHSTNFFSGETEYQQEVAPFNSSKDNIKRQDNADVKLDEDINSGAAIIIIHNGKILCGVRKDNGMVCGPGGHVKEGETEEQAAIRETMEEFKITPHKLIPLGDYTSSSRLYLPSKIYLTDEFSGIPEADGEEMMDAQWLSMEELRSKNLFPPFKESLDMLENLLKKYLTYQGGERDGPESA